MLMKRASDGVLGKFRAATCKIVMSRLNLL